MRVVIASPDAMAGAVPQPAVRPPEPASIMVIAAALVGIGVTMIYSASAVVGRPARPDIWNDLGLRQLFFVPPALGLMWLASYIPHTFWRIRRRWWLSPPLCLWLLAVGLVVAVLFYGSTVRGATRWFPLGVGSFKFYFQPSELAKLAVVITLAAILADRRFSSRSFLSGLLVLAVMLAAVIVPVVKEDFGTGFLIAVVATCLLLAGGARLWQMALLAVPAGAVGFLFVRLSEYRWRRVIDWLSGHGDAQGKGYQITQSLLTIASGGWFGRGLGEGVQKFEYLPADTTDFIFAIICEELGLAGAFLVIGLFILLLWQLRRVIAAAPDHLGQLLALGVTLVIGFQAAMNIAVVTDAVPTKGIALPFVSAGGSGLVLMSIALGLAASVARAARRRWLAAETQGR